MPEALGLIPSTTKKKKKGIAHQTNYVKTDIKPRTKSTLWCICSKPFSSQGKISFDEVKSIVQMLE
jgi:hypothetical protein